MSTRTIRRAAERQVIKAARKAAALSPQSEAVVAAAPHSTETKPEISPARLAANQANAQLSTGPASPEGKAISGQNRATHGLARRNGPFKLLTVESEADWVSFNQALVNEHQPNTETEFLLVAGMAESHWLANRAQRMQSYCCEPETGFIDNDRSFALYLRYETTHRRAFHNALNQLLKLRAEKRKTQLGFEAQKIKTEQHAMQKQTHKWEILRKESEIQGRIARNTAHNLTAAGQNPGFESQLAAALTQHNQKMQVFQDKVAA